MEHQNSSSTNANKFTFTWKIKHFSYSLERRGQHLSSPMFVINSPKDSHCDVTPNASSCIAYHWRLHLFPRGEEVLNIVEDFNLCLVYVRNGVVTTDYKLEVVDSDGGVVLTRSEEGAVFTADDQYHSLQPSLSEIHDIRRSVGRSKDTLIVRCSLWNIRGNIGKDVQCSATTRMCFNRMSKLWVVEGFSSLGGGIPQSTDLFLASSSPQPVIRLKAFLHGESLCESRLQIQIQMHRETCTGQSMMACKVSVMDSDFRAVEILEDRHWFPSNLTETWSLPMFITRKALIERHKDILPQDVLSLKFDIELAVGAKHHQIDSTLFGMSNIPGSDSWNGEVRPKPSNLRAGGFLRGDMRSLYQDKTLSDFQLKVGDRTFPVHRAILSARSPVFRTLLANDDQSVVLLISVLDVDPQTMSRMLTYIYTDTMDDMELEDFPKLYRAASKYGIVSLKEECSFALKSNIAVENVAMVLSLADMHQDIELMATAHDFILSRDEEVMRSVEWRQFVVNESLLAAKTMYEVYRKKLRIR